MKINCKPSGVTVERCIKVYKIKQWPFRRVPAQTAPQLLLRHVDLISHSLTPSCLPKSHRRCLTLANSEKPQMSGKFCMYKFSDCKEVSGERKGPVLFLFFQFESEQNTGLEKMLCPQRFWENSK